MTAALHLGPPGMLTTIQDLGRPNAVASGVPAGGAMDRFAHAAANLLVGNERSAATLECTLTGPHLTAGSDCVVAVTGGELRPRVNGHYAPTWTSLSLVEGDTLSFEARRFGARAYIAVAGGVIGDRWLGSMSTNLMCGRGGMQGRALAAGDAISVGDVRHAPVPGRTLPETLRPDYSDRALRVVRGPHFARLDAESQSVLLSSAFTVGHQSNRMGYRLDGAELRAPGEELLSFGVVAGALQLPSGGRPILLMADHQTAGGYPVIATVTGAWLPVAAQLAPGDELRFVEVSIEDALRARAAQRAALESLTI